MKQGDKLWTRDELILVIYLYCQLPFGKLDQNTPAVKQLAELLGRTPGAVSFKLNNFASFDPSLQERGIQGARNASKLDRVIWNEFFENIEKNVSETSQVFQKLFPTSVTATDDESYTIKEGEEAERLIKVRTNQGFFRRMILASYNSRCCITGIELPELLIASHIVTWKSDSANRLNPRNGICINALHDKAFEAGLITITPDYLVKVSNKIKQSSTAVSSYFIKYDSQPMVLPGKFWPDPGLLQLHNARFQQ